MAFSSGRSRCPTASGGIGRWNTFTVSKEDAAFFNLRCVINGNSSGYIQPGTYRRLSHDRTVVMSNTQMEVRTNIECFLHATGRVLINGLGLGMVLEGLLHKPDVTSIKVVELNKEVINIWNDICADNLPLMTKLTRKWARKVGKQGVWSRDMARSRRDR